MEQRVTFILLMSKLNLISSYDCMRCCTILLQVSLLLGAIGNQAEVPEEGRSLSAVMLRRLFSSEFEEFFAKLPEEQKAALKAQIILSVQQEPSKTVRRKCADLAAEVILVHQHI